LPPEGAHRGRSCSCQSRCDERLSESAESWAHKKEGKPLLEGTQHLFLKAKEDLTEEQAKERAHLGEQLPLLETAWQLKEA
jgi:hypothetical protein